MRRLHTLVAGAAALGLLAGGAAAQNLKAVKIASGFGAPVHLTSPPGDPRLFVVEQNQADIEIIHPDSTVTKFLDLSGKVSTGSERGLLGLAFHPDYANNGRFFVNYTRNNGNTRVEEYRVDPNDPDLADSNQVQTIIVVKQPFPNHNGGGLAFGPDGMLYVATGDGGSANDPQNNAQDGLELKGKMLRFDVDLPAPFIPPDNPFVGDPNFLDEIWALGLRNPWRYSFDRLTGDLYIGDVGQDAREEVDWQPASSTGGENYGWRCMEGFNCTGSSGCTCNGAGLTLPIHDFGQAGGNCSVIGGFVYRGPAPSIQGQYFFGDYCSSKIWSFEWDGVTMSNFTDRTGQLEPSGPDTISLISSFGEDSLGNLYILDHQDGEVYLVTEDCTGGSTSYCAGAPNSAGPGAAIGSSGSLSISQNDFVLEATGSLPNQFGLFFFGSGQQQVALGDGFLCVSGTLKRILPPKQADNLGHVSYLTDFTTAPMDQILAGDTRYFQWWYRDPAGPGGTGFNFSDGLSATFCR